MSQRRQVFEIYREALADQPQVQLDAGTTGLSFHALADLLHPAGTPTPGSGATWCCASLERHSIEARPVWKPMHLQPLFHGAPYFAHDGGDVSAGLFEAGICLPSGSNLTAAQQDRVIEQLRRALALAEDGRAAA